MLDERRTWRIRTEDMRHFVLGGRRVGGAGEQSDDRSEREHLEGHIFSFGFDFVDFVR